MASNKRDRESTLIGDIASEFRCSITSSLIVDPVITADGMVYEKQAISKWLIDHDTSPNTGKRLVSKTLTPALAIRSTISRLVDGGCLVEEEVREWKVRKAVLLIEEGSSAEGVAILRQAKADGHTAAGYHLGKHLLEEAKALLQEAADSGVAEAKKLLDDMHAAANTPTVATLQSVRDVRVGQRVRVLPLEVVYPIMRDHELSWNDSMTSMCGLLCKVLAKDADDDSLELEHPEPGERSYYFALNCLTRRG